MCVRKCAYNIRMLVCTLVFVGHLSLSVSVCLRVCVCCVCVCCVSLCVSLCLSLSLFVSLFLSLSLSFCLSLRRYLHLSVSVLACRSGPASRDLSWCERTATTKCLSVYLFVCLSNSCVLYCNAICLSLFGLFRPRRMRRVQLLSFIFNCLSRFTHADFVTLSSCFNNTLSSCFVDGARNKWLSQGVFF